MISLTVGLFLLNNAIISFPYLLAILVIFFLLYFKLLSATINNIIVKVVLTVVCLFNPDGYLDNLCNKIFQFFSISCIRLYFYQCT